MKREELLSRTRSLLWLAWQTSGDDMGSVAADTLTGLGMLVPEGGAAELEQLRQLVDASPAELSEAQAEALAAAGNRAVNDATHDDLCMCDAWPEKCLSSGGFFQGYWDTGALDTALPAVIGLWESLRAEVEVREMRRLRARVAELEALVEQATEYRAWTPGAVGLYVRRAPGTVGWAVIEALRTSTGRRAWTREGWQLTAIVARDALFCWPDGATAVAEARRLLSPGDAAPRPAPTECERLQARVDEVERKYVLDTAELKRGRDALLARVAELEAASGLEPSGPVPVPPPGLARAEAVEQARAAMDGAAYPGLEDDADEQLPAVVTTSARASAARLRRLRHPLDGGASS